MKRKKVTKKVIILFIIILIGLANKIYAKYNYTITLDAFSLKRDTSPIEYNIKKIGEEKEYTNKDVLLKIIVNKEIEKVNGFEIDDTRKILTKTISSNEENKIILKDLSGNTKELNYSVTNIDKELPQIIGIEDGETYNETKVIEYKDNTGIKDIFVDKYNENLEFKCVEHFYDSEYYKGLDVTGNKIHVEIVSHPKGTKLYRYYINNMLVSESQNYEYTYQNLNYGTTYLIKIEAIDENNNIIKTTERYIKTKYFSDIITRKEGDNFYVKITGIDSRVNIGYCSLWNQDTGTIKTTYPGMSSDRSLELRFNAYDVNGNKCYGYYYFHLQMWSAVDSSINDVLPMNVVFNRNYVKNEITVNPYILENNGFYHIIVTDLAGNISEKTCAIKK